MITPPSKTTKQINALNQDTLLEYVRNVLSEGPNVWTGECTIMDTLIEGTSLYERHIELKSHGVLIEISDEFYGAFNGLANFLYSGPILKFTAVLYLDHAITMVLHPMVTPTTTENNGPYYVWDINFKAEGRLEREGPLVRYHVHETIKLPPNIRH